MITFFFICIIFGIKKIREKENPEYCKYYDQLYDDDDPQFSGMPGHIPEPFIIKVEYLAWHIVGLIHFGHHQN
jgi:hypothetical protein